MIRKLLIEVFSQGTNPHTPYCDLVTGQFFPVIEYVEGLESDKERMGRLIDGDTKEILNMSLVIEELEPEIKRLNGLVGLDTKIIAGKSREIKQLLARVAEQAHRLEVNGRLIDHDTKALNDYWDNEVILKATVAELSKERQRAWEEISILQGENKRLEKMVSPGGLCSECNGALNDYDERHDLTTCFMCR